MRIENIKVDDELKKLLPPLSADELSSLEEDIKKHGVLDPIILWNGFIADGHNRYEICRKLGIEFVDIKELHKGSKAEVMEWIIDHQFARRNLTKSQIVLSREKVRKKYAEEAKERSGGRPRKDEKPTVNLPQVSEKKRNPTTDEKIAEKIGVSEKTYRNMRLITLEGTPEQIKRMDEGGKGNGVSAIAKEIKNEKLGIPLGHMKCKRCGRIKPIKDFARNGRDHECKKCAAKLDNEYRARRKEFGVINELVSEIKTDKKTPVKDNGTANEEIKNAISVFLESIRFTLCEMEYDASQIKETLTGFCEQIMMRVKEL